MSTRPLWRPLGGTFVGILMVGRGLVGILMVGRGILMVGGALVGSFVGILIVGGNFVGILIVGGVFFGGQGILVGILMVGRILVGILMVGIFVGTLTVGVTLVGLPPEHTRLESQELQILLRLYPESCHFFESAFHLLFFPHLNLNCLVKKNLQFFKQTLINYLNHSPETCIFSVDSKHKSLHNYLANHGRH